MTSKYDTMYRNNKEFYFRKKIRKINTRRFNLINSNLERIGADIRIGPSHPKESKSFSAVYSINGDPDELTLEEAIILHLQKRCFEK